MTKYAVRGILQRSSRQGFQNFYHIRPDISQRSLPIEGGPRSGVPAKHGSPGAESRKRHSTHRLASCCNIWWRIAKGFAECSEFFYQENLFEYQMGTAYMTIHSGIATVGRNFPGSWSYPTQLILDFNGLFLDDVKVFPSESSNYSPSQRLHLGTSIVWRISTYDRPFRLHEKERYPTFT